MPRKLKEGEDFRELQKLGMDFGSKDDSEFDAQADSGGLASGIIGKQEYGITGGSSIEDLDLNGGNDDDENLDSDNLILVADPESDLFTDPQGEFGATSEYSVKHALEEEDIVEKAERIIDGKAAKSQK